MANSFGIGGSGAEFLRDVDARPLLAFTIPLADLVRARPVSEGYRSL